jgi:deoxyadenosine/deoxycytidine kinase
MTIYAFSGKIGVGKDYCANYLRNKLKLTNYAWICFADPIKMEVICKDKINYNDVYVKKTTESRILLQKRGTEEGRNIYGFDIWVNYLKTLIKIYKERGVENFIITDVRFMNEYLALLELNAYIIRINAPIRNHKKICLEIGKDLDIDNDDEDYNKIKYHLSETNLDNVNFTTTINNDIGCDIEKEMKFIDIKRYELIVLEGNIASGKSTLLNKYESDKYNIIEEPLDKWDFIFDVYYKDVKKYGFAFQINALYTRYQLLVDKVKYDKINVMERYIFSDNYVFTEVLNQLKIISDEEMKVYKNIFQDILSKLIKKGLLPDKMIYIDTSPHNCNERRKVRGRASEENIDLDYLKLIDKEHKKLINIYKEHNINVEYLDNN